MSTGVVGRRRLDLWLVAHGLAESRAKAQALVMAGRVRINGERISKAGAVVVADAEVLVQPGPAHVGRGAIKLDGALAALGVESQGSVALDVGASTGGFTEALLRHGARRVYAVDVGHGQLHERIRADPRVVVVEGVNARYLTSREVPEKCALATIDVSFISVLKVLAPLPDLLVEGADVLALVKPQFELGRREVSRGGVVRDGARHEEALSRVAQGARDLGFAVIGACASPITGAAGNREFFLHLRTGCSGLSEEAVRTAVERAVRST